MQQLTIFPAFKYVRSIDDKFKAQWRALINNYPYQLLVKNEGLTHMIEIQKWLRNKK